MVSQKLTIIIPCYNEAERLPIPEFRAFLIRQENIRLLFVNDASKDETLEKLELLQKEFQNNIVVLSNQKNLGKSGSIRKGVHYCLENKMGTVLAYLDADLATSLEECESYLYYFEQEKQFVFASRILKIGSIVERKFSRFFFGRIIATIISGILDIKVYDTQCGCKLFTTEIAEIAFKRPFVSRWLFDVEIFSRIIGFYGKEKALSLMYEVPVKKWVDVGESKVKVTYFFKLWSDLYKIWRQHKKIVQNG